MQGRKLGSGEAYLGRCGGVHRGNVLEWQLEDELIIHSDMVGRGIPGTGRRVDKGRELCKVMES